MKNPWMSVWLSAANRNANTYASAARGLWAAEAQRQQQAMTKAWMEAMGLGAAPARKPPAKRRRR
jgi:hypothetical protein